MRVLVTGATGLIGSAVVARLKREGHETVAVARTAGRAARRLPASAIVVADIARMTTPALWLPHLAGIDALVNCAGVLQDGLGDSSVGVHVDGMTALFAACEQAGVRRVIHFSAIGVDRATPTEFSRTKLTGDQALMARSLDWVILRPSVVVGRPAYGGSALFRGLAALPVLPVVAGTGELQIVQLDDVSETVVFFLGPDAPARLVLELAGPDRLTLTDVVLAYRRWLGLGEPRRLRVPHVLMRLLYRLGDFAGLLGWRPPVRSTVGSEILRGAVGDPREWTRRTGIRPTALADALAAEPASVQERWFSGLFLLKPVVFTVLTLYWIATGLIALGPGWQAGELYVQAAHLGAFGAAAIITGASIDIAVGLAIAFRTTARAGLYAAAAVSVVYMAAATILLPRLWLDPLGPMIKILPVLALTVVALAILDDR